MFHEHQDNATGLFMQARYSLFNGLVDSGGMDRRLSDG